MKRGSGHIATLFGKYEAKKFASSESPSVVVDLQAESTPGSADLLQFSDSPPPVDTSIETKIDAQPTTTSSPHLPSGESADTYLPFECDPAKRIPISSYDVNDQDDVRRRYIAKGPNNPYAHDFPVRKIYGRNRHFSCVWFKCLKTLGELSIKLVETKKHVLYDLVYLLLKMVLILPVSTAMVERAFSSLSLVKTRLRNSLGNDLLNYCLVTYIERSLFLEVSEDDLLDAFMAMRRRKVDP